MGNFLKSCFPAIYSLQAGGAPTGQISSKKLQEKWDKEIPAAPLHRLLRVNAPEWWLITVGVVAAVINGSVFPVYSILFGEVLKVFQQSRTDQVVEEITIWAVLFLVLALSSAIAVFFKVLRTLYTRWSVVLGHQIFSLPSIYSVVGIDCIFKFCILQLNRDGHVSIRGYDRVCFDILLLCAGTVFRSIRRSTHPQTETADVQSHAETGDWLV